MIITGSTIQQLDKKRADGTTKPKSECRKWRLWVTTDSGRKSMRFTGTYSQAQNELKAFVSDLESQIPNSDTFGAYALSWLAWRKESGNYSPNTMAAEKTSLDGILRTDLARMRMDEIGAKECREALVWLKHNPKRGTEYKPTTMAKFRQVLFAIMEQAVEDDVLAKNPVDSVPRPKLLPTDKKALSPEEIQLLMNRLDELQLDGRIMALYLMLGLGLRCGEACALKTANIDNRYAFVDSAVRIADGSVGPPKSPASIRTLPVPPRIAAKVAEWRELRRKLGIDDAETLCCKKHGGLLTQGSVRGLWFGGKAFVGLRDKLGCSDMTLHELRHSNLSMVARHMSPFDLQRYAGWSSIAPAKIYIHEDLDAVSRAVQMAWA